MKNNNFFKIPFLVLTDFFRWNKIKKNIKIREDEVGLICPYGIGDTYNICCYLSKFINNNDISLVKVVVKPSQREIPLMFPEARIIPIVRRTPENTFLFFLHLFSKNYSELGKNKFVVAHPSFLNNVDFRNMGKNGLSIFRVYKRMLGLPENINADIPVISKENIASINRIFRKHRFKIGRTVLIAPDANSLKEFPDMLWKSIGEELVSRGFSVVINSKKYFNKKFTNLMLELPQIIPFLSVGGFFVSIRSGICELASTAKCTKVIIYPDGKSSSGSIMSCYDMQENNQNGRLLQYIYRKDEDIEIFIKNLIKQMLNLSN